MITMKMNHLFMAGAVLLGTGALAALTNPALAEEKSVTTTGDVTFVEDTETVPPVDPTDPDETVDPEEPGEGTSGPLSIDYASNFHFDKQKISAKDETYYALSDNITTVDGKEARPHWVQVTDKRGTNAGWKLQVQQAAQFTTGSKELKGAQIKMTNASVATTSDNQAAAPTPAETVTLTPTGAAQDVMTAQTDEGMGTWLNVFGTGQEGDQSISLSVPGTSEKVKDGKYTTELTWLLNDTPA